MKERWPRLLDDPELQDDPYLLTEIHGIGFLKADAVALALGIAPAAAQRLNAGAQYVLAQAEQAGHTGLPMPAFAEEMNRQLQCRLPETADLEGVIVDGEFLQRIATARAEQTVASILRILSRDHEPLDDIPTDGLADDQREAVEIIRYFPVCVLLGGPGVGKTHTIRHLLNGMDGLKVALCAPTGKAAKRIEELSGRPAQTIHRLLGVDIERNVKAHSLGFAFRNNRVHRLPHDIVIVDEASMIDTRLMADLCEALRDDARLVLVGDPFQLPAVGPGAVLRDLTVRRTDDRFTGHGLVPSFELTELKRQDPKLLIAQNCKSIRYERRVVIANETASDFYFAAMSDAQTAQNMIVDLVARRLPAKYGFDPKREIVVLTALREKGLLSARELNRALRKALNVENAHGVYPTVGDRVIQTSNNYDLEVMNGDLGTIEKDGFELAVKFDTPEREVCAERDKFDLQLAYALTVHRAQGSEWPCVVIPIHEEQGTMVTSAQWLYTSISRARQIAVLVGSRGALDAMAARHRDINRMTKLAELLAR